MRILPVHSSWEATAIRTLMLTGATCIIFAPLSLPQMIPKQEWEWILQQMKIWISPTRLLGGVQ